MTGVVRYWHRVKRFGKIAGDDGVDYFFHLSELLDQRALRIGTSVTFTATDRGRGPRAIDVQVVATSGLAPSWRG